MSFSVLDHYNGFVLNNFIKKIENISLTKEAKEKCKSELKKLKNMSPMSAEATVIRNYLDWVLSIPCLLYTSPSPRD